jgi:hypothetical protein
MKAFVVAVALAGLAIAQSNLPACGVSAPIDQIRFIRS